MKIYILSLILILCSIKSFSQYKDFFFVDTAYIEDPIILHFIKLGKYNKVSSIIISEKLFKSMNKSQISYEEILLNGGAKTFPVFGFDRILRNELKIIPDPNINRIYNDLANYTGNYWGNNVKIIDTNLIEKTEITTRITSVKMPYNYYFLFMVKIKKLNEWEFSGFYPIDKNFELYLPVLIPIKWFEQK